MLDVGDFGLMTRWAVSGRGTATHVIGWWTRSASVACGKGTHEKLTAADEEKVMRDSTSAGPAPAASCGRMSPSKSELSTASWRLFADGPHASSWSS